MKQPGTDIHSLFERALEIDRSAFGPGDSRSVRDLINVAASLRPGNNEERERLLKQALDLALQNPKLGTVPVLEALSYLAQLYQTEQRWYDAEPLAEKGMKICASSSPFPGPCESLQGTLAEVYRNEGRSVDAGQVAASTMDEGIPPELDALNKSAQRDEDDGLYVQAEFKYRQAVAWVEAHPLGPSGQILTDLTGMLSVEYNGIGRALEKQGRDGLAEESYKKSIESQETRALENPMSARSFGFSQLTNLYRREGRLSEMEPVIQHTLSIQEKAVGESSTNVAGTLVIFADLLKDEGKYAEAEPLYERASKIEEANLGPDNPRSLATLSSYADLLLKSHKDAKASELQARISEIEKKQAGH